MRLFLFIFSFFICQTSLAQWLKINEIPYTWGPFQIYRIALFSENGQYQREQRPLMLELTYEKPVDGRDFAISLARSWANLAITFSQQEEIVDLLRKELPDLKPQDKLSYIALTNRGYFVHNNTIIPINFSNEFSQAFLDIWLDKRVEWSLKLTTPQAGENNEKNENLDDALPAILFDLPIKQPFPRD